MKILVIGPLPLPINGCSIANQILVDHLGKRGDVSFKTIDTNTVNISSDKVGTFSFRKFFSFFRSYKQLLLIRNADVVYTTPGQTFLGIAKYIPFFTMCLVFSKPYIIHIHGNHLGNEYKTLTGVKKQLFDRFIGKAAAGIVLSESLRANFDGLLPSDRVYVVENFALNELISEKPVDKPKDLLRLLYLSNLMTEKGILDVLDGLLILLDKGIPFKADIAGKIEDESYEIVSERLKKLEGYITYHGPVFGQQKVDLLDDANVFILPTYYKMEGQPISIIEAMATGNIVVSTKFSGIPDIMNLKNGFFVESKSPTSVAGVLTEISTNIGDHVQRISQNNADHVKANFTEEKFASKILAVMEKSITLNK